MDPGVKGTKIGTLNVWQDKNCIANRSHTRVKAVIAMTKNIYPYRVIRIFK